MSEAHLLLDRGDDVELSPALRAALAESAALRRRCAEDLLIDRWLAQQQARPIDAERIMRCLPPGEREAMAPRVIGALRQRRRSQRRRRSGIGLGVLLAAALLLAVGNVVVRQWSSSQHVSPVVSGPAAPADPAALLNGPLSLQWGVGTHADLAAGAQARQRTDGLDLIVGSASFHVAPRTTPFTVGTANATVTVIGTAFTVAHGTDGTAVVVREGVVAVRGAGKDVRVPAGQAVRVRAGLAPQPAAHPDWRPHWQPARADINAGAGEPQALLAVAGRADDGPWMGLRLDVVGAGVRRALA
ncbi:MAG: FecR domain-containing protein [Planctomycetota bacterium]|nr:FecR domain-containing protein [Planctomycetota bacterium]